MKAKFAWTCQHCLKRHVWAWSVDEYYQWVTTHMKCEKCGKETIVSERPERIK